MCLKRKKLIITKKDKADHCKRLVKLSSKGKQLAIELAPLWEDVQTVADEILYESAPDLLEKLSKLEKALQHKSTFRFV